MPVITQTQIQQQVPKLNNRVGGALIRGAMHLASLDRVNALYDRCSHLQGADFAGALMRDIGIDYLIGNPERLEALPEGPFITVSNHPFGHIDGIIMIDLFGHLRQDYKVMVNQLLAHIRAMSPNFIEVVPKGNVATGPKAASLAGVRDTLGHLRDGHPVGFFPSGAVSDLSLKEHCIRDREWQEAVLRLIQKARVPVIPVRFFDRNSMFFYRLGLIDWRVRLVRLCAEVFNKRGKQVRLGIGETISVEKQSGFASIQDYGKMLRDSVYQMPLPTVSQHRSELNF